MKMNHHHPALDRGPGGDRENISQENQKSEEEGEEENLTLQYLLVLQLRRT